MEFYADVHIHSHYSRATSKDLDLEHLSLWAQKKGIQVVGTGDCIHPKWLEELRQKLEPAEEGLFRLKPEYVVDTAGAAPKACEAPVRFMLTVELSNIYKRDGKVRKIHHCIFVPSFEAAAFVQSKLDAIGNIHADGRPILGIDSRDLLEIVLESNPGSYLIPAHIWTPWFAVLGSKSGFDTIEECFGDLSSYIFALETGLSSDPPMNWRLSRLDPYLLVSNSDAHSPAKLGREATIYDTELSYPAIHRALSDRDDSGLVGTIEFFPEEGKYHYDGHRLCKTRMHPTDTAEHDGLCPVCGRPVTVGVMSRVDKLADRQEGSRAPLSRFYQSLIPLPEIIAEALGFASPSGKAVTETYEKLLTRVGNELHILRHAPLEEIAKTTDEMVAEGVRRVRAGKVEIAAGYDGEYGTIGLFTKEERGQQRDQLTLF